MKKFRALTLMELIVAIAIVAFLSTIGFASYKHYVTKARVAKIMSTVNGLIDEAIAFRIANAVFPTTTDLGLPEDPANTGNAAFTDPIAISPYLSSISMQDSAYGTSCPTCCAGGEYVVTMLLNGPAIGRSDIGTTGGCGSIGIKLIVGITTDGNVRKLCVTDYDSKVVSSNDCTYTCEVDSANWPDVAKDTLDHILANMECGRSSY